MTKYLETILLLHVIPPCFNLFPNSLFRSREDPRLCPFCFLGGGVGGSLESLISVTEGDSRLSNELMLPPV